MSGRSAGLVRDVAGAVIGQPLDGLRQSIDPAEAMLDGRHHQVANIVTLDPFGRSHEAHGFPVAAVEREGYPDLLAVVTGDLEAVRAPPKFAAVDGDRPSAAILTPA